MPRIQIRKNVIVRIELTGTTSEYPVTINNVDFTPDDMIVKYVNYFYEGNTGIPIITSFTPVNVDFTSVAQAWPVPNYDFAGELYMSLLYTDLVNDYIACIVDYPLNNRFDTIYTMNKPINGIYNFSIRDMDGTTLRTNRNGFIIIHLEFVKYK